MQTFLPHSDFVASAKALDYRRLGKQRVEAKQIYNALITGPLTELPDGTFKKTAWFNHPAVRMWKGFEQSLLRYGRAICEEWISRGYKDSLLPFFIEQEKQGKGLLPGWLGLESFHDCHKGLLYRKDPEFYSKFVVYRDVETYWPEDVV